MTARLLANRLQERIMERIRPPSDPHRHLKAAAVHQLFTLVTQSRTTCFRADNQQA